MSVTNRDLFDEGWRPSTIMIRRENERFNQELDWSTTNDIDTFKEATFLVDTSDKKLISYLDKNGYNYE